MKKTEKKNTKLRLFLRFFLILLVLTALVSAVLLALNKYRASSETGGSKAISFDPGSTNLYSWIDGGLVIASGSGIQLINEGGDTQVADTAILEKPAVASGAGVAAVWSVGSKDFYTVSKAKGAVKTATDREVINVYVNSNNWLAVSAEENGYKGAVSIYDSKLKPVYKWSSGEGYLVGAAVSDGNDKMAALTLGDTGSKLSFFSLSSTNLKGSYTCDNTTLFDLSYLASSSVCALSNNSAFFVSDSGSLISKYDFSDGYLKDYSLGGSGFAALVIGKYKAGSAGTIVTLSPTGTPLGKLDVSGEILSVSARGKYLAVLYSDSLVIYRSDMTVYAKVTDTANVRQVLMRSDGSAVMLSNSGAAVYKP